MSQNQRIKIPRTSDRSVIDCFRKLCVQYKIASVSISSVGYAQIGSVNLTEESNEEFNTLLSHDSTLINTCSIAILGLSISFHRGGTQQQNPSPIYDELSLTWNQQQGNSLSNTDKINIVAFINSELNAFQSDRFVDSGLSQEQNELLAIHNSTLERLERLNEDLVRQSAEFREQVEKKFDAKASELEEETKEKQAKLEQDYEEKAHALEVNEKELAGRLKTIDDRDNTHVRREIRDKMLDDVKKRIENFGVSEATEKKRKPAFIGIALLIISLLSLMLFTGYEINSAEKNYAASLESPTKTQQTKLDQASTINPRTKIAYVDRAKVYWLWARFALFSFALLGSLLYYIKWQNQWAEQHSASEFQLQQFYIDVNRANWAIESCLEWRKETDSEIPDELLNSITRNLFSSAQGENEHTIHPADELASALMGSASKLRLKLNGNELEFNKPRKIPNNPIATPAQKEPAA